MSTRETCYRCDARDWVKAGLCPECLGQARSQKTPVRGVGEVSIQHGGILLKMALRNQVISRGEAEDLISALQAKVRLL